VRTTAPVFPGPTSRVHTLEAVHPLPVVTASNPIRVAKDYMALTVRSLSLFSIRYTSGGQSPKGLTSYVLIVL